MRDIITICMIYFDLGENLNQCSTSLSLTMKEEEISCLPKCPKQTNLLRDAFEERLAFWGCHDDDDDELAGLTSTCWQIWMSLAIWFSNSLFLFTRLVRLFSRVCCWKEKDAVLSWEGNQAFNSRSAVRSFLFWDEAVKIASENRLWFLSGLQVRGSN